MTATLTRRRGDERLTPSELAKQTHNRAEAARPERERPPEPRPSWNIWRGVPTEWQRTTMAHLCSVYPFHADTGFGERGVLAIRN